MNRFFTFTFFIMFAVQAYPQKVESIAVGPSSRVYEVIRPNEEKISISNGLPHNFLMFHYLRATMSMVEWLWM